MGSCAGYSPAPLLVRTRCSWFLFPPLLFFCVFLFSFCLVFPFFFPFFFLCFFPFYARPPHPLPHPPPFFCSIRCLTLFPSFCVGGVFLLESVCLFCGFVVSSGGWLRQKYP